MKTLLKLFLFVNISMVNIIADEIYLKGEGDNNLIMGKVLKVSDTQIEYDPDGDIPFAIISRDRVIKIKYDNNEMVYLNMDEGSRESVKISDKHLSLEFELGWNGYTGIGIRSDFLVFKAISFNLGVGLAGWGYRLSGGSRFYFNYPYSGALCIGAAYNTGLKDFPQNMETTSGQVEEVIMDLNPISVVNITYLHNFKINENLKFYFEAGYGISLNKDNYTITNNKILADRSKQVLSLSQPGGVIISIGMGRLL